MSLELGLRRPLLVRREAIPGLGLRLLYASDLHLRWDNQARICRELLCVARHERPDLILLGGDLVDTAGGLRALARLLPRLKEVAQVAAVEGNHDWWVGVARVRRLVLGCGALWLADRPLTLADHRVVARPEDFAGDLYGVLCAHYPSDFPRACQRGLKLVFAGHLHGGQLVFGQHRDRLYPGAFYYRWNGLRFQQGQARMLVSRGMTDMAPIRWNCPREVLVAEPA